MAINVNLIPQVQTLTLVDSGVSLTLSSEKIIKLKEVDAGTLVTYLANKGTVKTKTVTQSAATIASASGDRLQGIYDNTFSGTIWINSNLIIFADQKAGFTLVTYYNYTNGNEVINTDNDASQISSTAGNMYAVICPATRNVTQQTRYINSLLVDSFVEKTTEQAYALQSAVPSAAGTNYLVNDVLTLVGGTSTLTATAKVSTLKPVSLATNAAGNSYNVGDTILTAGGTASTHATLTVTHLKAVVAPGIVSGGTGYTTGDHVSVTTGTGTQAVYTVAATAGVVTALTAVFSAGDYTVRPTLGTSATTGGGGTGLTVNLVAADFGVKTAVITIAGSYTVGSSTFTQNSSSGAGTSATFNTVVYGINTLAPLVAGVYSVPPTNPVSVTGGTGTGATLTADFEISNVTGAQILYNTFDSAYKLIDVEQTVAQLIDLQNTL